MDATTTEASMKFMILVKATAEAEAEAAADFEAGTSAMKEQMAAMEAYNEELRKAGVLKDVDGLRPSREAKRVRFDGQSRSVVDGPFTQSKEIVCGYWIWELPSIDDAVAWVKRCPNPMRGPSEIEIRPI